MTDNEYLEKCCYPLVLCNEELEHNKRLRSISDKLARYEKALRFYADPSNFCVTENMGITECEPPHDYAMCGASYIGTTARKALEDK